MTLNTSSNVNLKGSKNSMRLLHLAIIMLRSILFKPALHLRINIASFTASRTDAFVRFLANMPVEEIDFYLFLVVGVVGIIAIIGMCMPLAIEGVLQ